LVSKEQRCWSAWIILDNIATINLLFLYSGCLSSFDSEEYKIYGFHVIEFSRNLGLCMKWRKRFVPVSFKTINAMISGVYWVLSGTDYWINFCMFYMVSFQSLQSEVKCVWGSLFPLSLRRDGLLSSLCPRFLDQFACVFCQIGHRTESYWFWIKIPIVQLECPR
jgi:hypothetical protein